MHPLCLISDRHHNDINVYQKCPHNKQFLPIDAGLDDRCCGRIARTQSLFLLYVYDAWAASYLF